MVESMHEGDDPTIRSWKIMENDMLGFLMHLFFPLTCCPFVCLSSDVANRKQSGSGQGFMVPGNRNRSPFPGTIISYWKEELHTHIFLKI